MRKVKSAGILVKSGDKFLLCHATGMKIDKGWGLPKGRVDDGETLKQTAVREVYEECGLKIPISDIKYLTETSYRTSDDHGPARKTLAVFVYECDESVQQFPLICHSYFVPKWYKSDNVKVPECDKFKWLSLEDAESLAMKSIKGIFSAYKSRSASVEMWPKINQDDLL